MTSITKGLGVLEWFLAARLLSARKRSYVSLVSGVSMLGLALGVASLVLVFGVTSGFEAVFRQKTFGLYPHLVVVGKGGDLPDWRDVVRRLEKKDEILSASPATYDEMMASHGGRRGGAIVKGIVSSDAKVSATIQPFLHDCSVGDLNIEPRFSFDGGKLPLPALPGGASFALVITPDGSLLSFPCFEEAGAFPRIRLLSTGPSAVDVRVSGVLGEKELTLGRAEPSEWIDMPEGEASITVGNALVEMTVNPGNSLVFVSMEGGAPTLLSCPEYPPGPSTSSAHVCIANFLDTEVFLVSKEKTLSVDGRLAVDKAPGSVAPGTVLNLEVFDTVKPRVILGKELAARIGATVGDEIRLVSPLFSVPGIGSRPGKDRMIADTFVVAGTISLGFYEYDSKLALIDFASARRMLHQGDTARWVEVRIEDIFQSVQRGVEISRLLGDFSLLDVASYAPPLVEKYTAATEGLQQVESPLDVVANVNRVLAAVKFSNVSGELSFGYEDRYRIITWEEMNQPIFTSMKRQRIALTLFFLIIIVVATFNIVTSQVMIVKDKTPDIAILKSMGATPAVIKRVFLLHGMAIGSIGVVTGMAVAALVGVLLDRVGFPLDPKVYFVSKLPMEIVATDFLTAGVISFLSIYVAVSVAARRAAEKKPVEGLTQLD